MKTLITFLILMVTSVLGFSQTDTVTLFGGANQLYNGNVVDTLYVTIDEKITIINSYMGTSFDVDTNGRVDTTNFGRSQYPTNFKGLDTIIKYTVNSKSDSIYINEYLQTYGWKIILKDTSRVTGINEFNDTKINFGIFPNPAKSDLTIKSDTKIEKIEIINISGQIAKTINLTNSEIFEYKLNVEDLTNGLYFVRINDTGVQKLVINK